MTVLAGQTIRALRVLQKDGGFCKIFEPFEERTRHEESGMTYGLSVAGYDVRVKDGYRLAPGEFTLAVTMERFCIPNNLIAIVHDKSTLARMGLAVQNTVAEPGWEGWLTLELTNHGDKTITILPGQPIAQILLHKLDDTAEKPYEGRYQNQGPEPVAAKRLDGTEEKI